MLIITNKINFNFIALKLANTQSSDTTFSCTNDDSNLN